MDEGTISKRSSKAELLVDKDDDSLDKKIDGSKWNDKIEYTIKDVGETAKAFKMMHIEMARHYSRIYKIYAYLGIIMGPLAGIITGFQPSFVFPTELDVFFTIFVTIISFLSGAIVAIIKFGKFDEASSANKLAASRYTSLESNVRRQLSLYREDRPPAKMYLEWITKAIDELFLASPLIPYKIYTIYQPKNHEYSNVIMVENSEEKVKELADTSAIKVVVPSEKKVAEDDSGSEEPSVDTGKKIHPIPVSRPSVDHMTDSDSRPPPPNKRRFTSQRKDSRMSYSYDLGRFKNEQMNYELRRFMNMP